MRRATASTAGRTTTRAMAPSAPPVSTPSPSAERSTTLPTSPAPTACSTWQDLVMTAFPTCPPIPRAITMAMRSPSPPPFPLGRATPSPAGALPMTAQLSIRQAANSPSLWMEAAACSLMTKTPSSSTRCGKTPHWSTRTTKPGSPPPTAHSTPTTPALSSARRTPASP